VAAGKPLLTRSGRLVHSCIPEVPLAKMNGCLWHLASIRTDALNGRYRRVISTGRRNTWGQLAINNDDG
jgi:hypothetical protein